MEELKIKILDNFKGLEFVEEEHKYFYNSKPISISVSGLIKKFVKEFDAYKISGIIAQRDGLDQKDILQGWKDTAKEATDKGHSTHLFGEVYPFNRHLKPSTNLEKAIVKFWDDLPPFVIPIMTEVKMFHKKYMFAGTADILLYNTITETFIIGDYKTNKDLFKNYKGIENNFQGQMMLSPFENMLDCPFNKYQLQLSFYQLLFEQTGFRVSSRKLIWLLPDGTYKLYDLDDHTRVLKEQLKTLKF